MREKKQISKTAYKILEVPGLEDNYYHNIMDFNKNQISIVLGNNLYLHNGHNIELIYEAYDCEEISSVSFNKEGTKICFGNILGEI